MNKQGKTLTIFLIVISILLLSITAITLFFLKQENDLRKSLESQLAQAKASVAKLDADLKEAKTKNFVMEDKMKDADKKINDLLADLDTEKGLREESKIQIDALSEALASEKKTKEDVQKELTGTREKITSLEEKIKGEETLRADLETKLKTAEETVTQPEVELDKIVVAPGQIPDGKIISVNAENNFVVFDLGQEQRMVPELILSVYHGDKYLGDVKVARVEAKMSVADLVAPLSSKQIQKNDKVVVKK